MKLDGINIKTGIGIISLIPAFLIPLIFGINQYLLTVLIITLVFIIYSSAWNLLALSGQASLGHAAFFGIGGYVSAIVANTFGMPPIAAIPVGGLFATFIGVLIGFTCIRMREWFLAMVTFGFAIIAHTITTELSWLTGGWDGIPAKRLIPVTITNYIIYEYYIMLLIAVVVVVIIHLIKKSRMGLAMEAIRENELEAKVMGINVTKYKLMAFAVSAFFTGIAGALEIHHFGYITPEVYGMDISFWPIIYSISGGLFTVGGPILGTIVITFIWEVLRTFGLMYERFILIGVILVLIVIFLPKGLVSVPEKIKSRLRRF
ncbi:branched-chain amino acid ABC transporter permease [Methanophagales archaeon]|nr:MAG: branched-chain amino acid ABC transporter permease [Methanophagales archaeon]